MDRLREHDLEGVEEKVAALNRTAEKFASDVEDIGLQFMSIDSLPTAIESLDNAVFKLAGGDSTEQVADSSVAFEVKTPPEHSANIWGVLCSEHPPGFDCETCREKAKKLNAALNHAIERVLIWTLKDGSGFKKNILGRNIEQAMETIVKNAISVIGVDGSRLNDVLALMKHDLDEYFGMVY